MSLIFCRSVHLTMNIVLIAFIVVVMVVVWLLLAILIIRITAHWRLMPWRSVVSILWTDMLQRLPNAGHVRITKNLGGGRL